MQAASRWWSIIEGLDIKGSKSYTESMQNRQHPTRRVSGAANRTRKGVTLPPSDIGRDVYLDETEIKELLHGT